MPKKADPTLTVLREIRDELREHRRILGEHRDLLVDHGQKLGALERRHVESEVRLATELVAVASAVQQVRDLLRDRLDERDRVTRLEERVDALERRRPPAAE